MTTNTIRQLLSMVSGECRWIGRYDIHAYRHSPMGYEPQWCVCCTDAGLKHGNWVDLDTAARQIDSILATETSDAA
jgi:hypothetical protein